jgi:23S rRNA (cytidine1920-2'-O)/16S rRNA (cytidine1409-2'-O)-methyltransferase
MRLDKLMLEQGLVKSRSRAQALILAGKVYVEGQKIEKAGHDIPEGSFIEIRGPDHPYVSRGGVKLAYAIKRFRIICKDKIALDIGASTGGFTDCLLQHGARKVYALDVGFGQLDWHLRQDNRVVNLERINIRYIDPDVIVDPLDIVTIDCSFISLKLVIKSIFPMITDGTELICLIKPQFEVERGEVGKGGVIRDRAKHERVLQGICAFVQEMDFHIQGLISSPIKGPKGNKEFLLYMIKGAFEEKIDLQEAIQEVLDET